MTDKKTTIFDAGRDMFLSKGFKDVNVSDITKQAGVSVGTFYNYYTSKEELFAEIYHRENEMAKKAIIESVNADADDDPVSITTSFVSQVMGTLKSNLILKEWYDRDVLGELEKKYRNKDTKNDSFVYVFFKGLLKKWRAEGKIRNDIDDSHVLGLYDALIYLDTHKKEAGLDPLTMQLLAEFIIKGVTNLKKNKQ